MVFQATLCYLDHVFKKYLYFVGVPNTESKGHFFYKATFFIFSHYLCGMWVRVNKGTQV